jgi:hypothetical protein
VGLAPCQLSTQIDTVGSTAVQQSDTVDFPRQECAEKPRVDQLAVQASNRAQLAAARDTS